MRHAYKENERKPYVERKSKRKKAVAAAEAKAKEDQREAEELAKLNRQLAIKKQEEEAALRAEIKREQQERSLINNSGGNVGYSSRIASKIKKLDKLFTDGFLDQKEYTQRVREALATE